MVVLGGGLAPCEAGLPPRQSVGGGIFFQNRNGMRFPFLKTAAFEGKLTFGDPYLDSGAARRVRHLAKQRLAPLERLRVVEPPHLLLLPPLPLPAAAGARDPLRPSGRPLPPSGRARGSSKRHGERKGRARRPVPSSFRREGAAWRYADGPAKPVTPSGQDRLHTTTPLIAGDMPSFTA